jgi:hypothetical protein
MVLNQTTLGELYQSLSPEEEKGLELYLQKNTVGKNNILYQLHKLMAQVKQQTMMAKLDTDYIKAELFGGDEKSVSKLTTYNNLLINHIKDYLILSKVKEKNIYTETLWGEILIERGLKRNLLLKLTNYKFNLLKDSYANLKNFLNVREEFFYQFITLTKKNYLALLEAQYKQFQAFNEYEMYYKLELIISIITLSSRHKVSVKSINIDEAKILVKQGVKSNNDLIKIQALSLNLIIDRDNNSYYELLSIFKEKENQISNDLLTQMVPNLLNYGFVRIHAGNEDFEKDNYQLLSFLFEKRKLFTQGIFSVARVITYIRSELRYGTIEKAEQLLEESLKVISPAQKDSFQYLIESRISFAKKDYKVSLRKISTNQSIRFYLLFSAV